MHDARRLLHCGCAGSNADADDLEGAPLLRPNIMSAEMAASIGAELRLDIGICSVDRDGGDDVLEVLMRSCAACAGTGMGQEPMNRREALDLAHATLRTDLHY